MAKPIFNARQKKLSEKEFFKELQEFANELQSFIEAEVSGFSTKPEDIAQRRKAVFDKKTGFKFFVQNYFPQYIKHASESDLHQYLFQRLPEIAASPDSESEALGAPRGEAKSTLVTQLHTLWRIVTNQTRFALIVMDSIDQAFPMLETIKAELEFNPRLKADFPKHCGQGRKWQAGEIVTQSNIKVQVAGSGKKLRGLRHGAYRPDLVVLDDIENDEQVQSPKQRNKLQSWLEKAIEPLGEVGKKFDIIYIGTVLHYDSVLNRTLKNPMWHSRVFKAIKRFPERMDLWQEWELLIRNDGLQTAMQFYQQNKEEMHRGAETSWAARDILALMKIRVKIGSQSFACEYQNDPASSEDSPFAHLMDNCYYSSLPSDVVYFGALDPSLGKQGKGRDPSAILVGAYQKSTGILFVEVAQIKRRVPDLIIEDVIALQKQYHCQVWAVETVQFQAFLKDELVKRSAQRGCAVPARGVKPTTDKMLRIESLQPHIANGLIKFRPEQSVLIEQLRYFPHADHDDGADALQMLWALASTRSAANQMRPIKLYESCPY